MKRLLATLLVVLMLCGGLAAGGSAHEGGYTSYTFNFPEDDEGLEWDGYLPPMLLSDDDFIFIPKESGKHTVTISHTGTYKFWSYKIWKGDGAEREEFAAHNAFPESAVYDFTAGETYCFVFNIVNTGAAAFRFEIESSTGEKTTYDIIPDDLRRPAGNYVVTISHTGKFELNSYELWKTKDDVEFEKFVSYYGSFPERTEYTLAEGEHIYFRFQITRATSEPVSITITIHSASLGHWWDNLPSFLQWIMRYLLFGWVWMDSWFWHTN